MILSVLLSDRIRIEKGIYRQYVYPPIKQEEEFDYTCYSQYRKPIDILTFRVYTVYFKNKKIISVKKLQNERIQQ